MTRKLFALALAALPALAAARDLKVGTFEVGAGTNLNIGSMTTDVNDTEFGKISTTAFNGNALYYVANDFGLGLDLTYDKTKTEYGAVLGGGSSTTTQWTVGPIAKLNFPVSPSVSIGLLGGS